jgi:hypothetical protein
MQGFRWLSGMLPLTRGSAIFSAKTSLLHVVYLPEFLVRYSPFFDGSFMQGSKATASRPWFKHTQARADNLRAGDVVFAGEYFELSLQLLPSSLVVG